MTAIAARIIDATHLELSEPISAAPGETVYVAILADGDEEREWREAGHRQLLKAYADEDAVYDNL